MALGANVKKFREQAGLTQTELAERAGIDQQAIAALEKRDSQSSRFVAAIAIALGKSIPELMGEEVADRKSKQESLQVWPDDIAKLITLFGLSTETGRQRILEFAEIAEKRNQQNAELSRTNH